MRDMTLQEKDSPFLMKMFQKILITGLVSLVIGAFICIFLAPSVPEHANIMGVSLIAVVFTVGAILLSFSLLLLKQGRHTQSVSMYLWVTTAVLSYAAWLGGGLYGITIMSFPVLLLFAGLFAEMLMLLSIGGVLIGVTVLMGMESIYISSSSTADALIAPEARLISYISIMIASGYCGWGFNCEMKEAFTALDHEHQLVVESQGVIDKLAYTDALTGLHNRASAKQAYEKMLAEIDFDKECIAFYFIDLDNFKVVNDLFDHESGDQLLVTMARRLQELSREEDIACRLGGDEFIVFGRTQSAFDFDGLAQKVMNIIAQPYHFLGAKAEVTASIGIALVTDEGLSFDEARKKSDMAMYKAKQSGKNKYHYYSESLHAEYMKSLNVLSGLKDALAENLLDLHFQPKINLATNKIDSAEALLRWSRGNPNGYTPGDFIPVLESTELIHEIGAWVLEEACLICKEWHKQGHKISVAVNVSVLQITRVSFYDTVKEVLSKSGLGARFLELELTEHVLLTDNKEARARVKAVKDLGITLAIDDFGTGYSNMNYLTSLKVDVLKLDRSFIANINTSNDSLVIITAIIEMAKVLGMKVVAEGVELQCQRDTLEQLGCYLGQGFLWSKALPVTEFLSSLDEPFKTNNYTV